MLCLCFLVLNTSFFWIPMIVDGLKFWKDLYYAECHCDLFWWYACRISAPDNRILLPHWCSMPGIRSLQFVDAGLPGQSSSTPDTFSVIIDSFLSKVDGKLLFVMIRHHNPSNRTCSHGSGQNQKKTSSFFLLLSEYPWYSWSASALNDAGSSLVYADPIVSIRPGFWISFVQFCCATGLRARNWLLNSLQKYSVVQQFPYAHTAPSRKVKIHDKPSGSESISLNIVSVSKLSVHFRLIHIDPQPDWSQRCTFLFSCEVLWWLVHYTRLIHPSKMIQSSIKSFLNFWKI